MMERRLLADRFVFACGAWLPKVFPDVVGGRIRPTRQTVVYFSNDARDDVFRPGTHARRGSTSRRGSMAFLTSMGTGSRSGSMSTALRSIRIPAIESQTMAPCAVRARGWNAGFPAMRDARMIEARICQYENTSTGDFLIDRHPACDNVWLVGGGSGHGFKHGPAVGEDTARMVLDGQPVSPRFALATKSTEARRAVY
jgi:glycine/D-amino acid oxidase-like deaminating enzyme